MLLALDQAAAKALDRKAEQLPDDEPDVNWAEVFLEIQDYLATRAKDEWRSTFVPLLQGVIEEQARVWEVEFGLRFDVRNLFAEKWFEDYELRFADPISRTTSDALSDLLQQAEREGWSLDQTKTRIRAVFRQWMKGDLSPEDFAWLEQRMPDYRVEAIARTETIRAANAGTWAIFAEAQVPAKEWSAAMDSRTRPTHAAAHGQVRRLDEPFEVGGERLMYPGDPNASIKETIQCRCTILPVFDLSLIPAGLLGEPTTAATSVG